MRLWFIAILAAEWRGALDWSHNFKIPLIFAHLILTKMLDICRVREIRLRITMRMELWERGIHMGLVGDVEMEVYA